MLHCIAVANSITVEVIIEYAALDYVQFYNAMAKVNSYKG